MTFFRTLLIIVGSLLLAIIFFHSSHPRKHALIS